ncbi:MAG: sterol-binding protein [Verrucomicrobiaceae bacterium]|nr:sterol-binding protein [Verrucomicrobiaceae bacterium]
MPSISELTATLNEKLVDAKPFGKKIKFAVDGGVIFLDGTANPPTVSNNDDDADVTISGTLDDFIKIMNKQMNAQMALMMGKIKLKGDMMAAMALSKLF